jgi:hypothetical protein
LRDDEGRTALMRARENKQTGVMAVLSAAPAQQAAAPQAARPVQAPRAAARPAQAHQAARPSSYKIPDWVEVNYDGQWYPGTIYAAENGRYKVMRSGYTSDERWFTAAELRPYVPPVEAKAPVAGLPRTVPTGRYVCTTLMSGFGYSNSMNTTIGELRVVGNGVYTRLTKEGVGPQARFGYDPSTGKIDWEGGQLQGFFGKVEETTLGRDSQGVPVMDVIYRVREGGSRFNLSCLRRGA